MSEYVECEECEGMGYVTWSEDYWRGGHQTRERSAECETCGGDGEVEAEVVDG